MKNKDKLRHVSHTNEWLEHIYETIIQKDEKEYAFVEMNIKQFRYINIEYGCAFGDHVLVSMQQLLETQLKGRGYVARRYADTFDFFVEHNHETHVLDSFLMDIIDAVFENGIEGLHKNLYTSFGIYLLHEECPPFAKLQTLAGIARKQLHHDRRTFSYELAQQDVVQEYLKTYRLSTKLTQARFLNQFQIYIQPKVELQTHKICGGELLMRWILEDGTMVYVYLYQKWRFIYD